MKTRALKCFIPFLCLLSLAFIYKCLNEHGIVSIPCIFHVITNLDCPGCGVTRMLFAVLNLEFKLAFHYNFAIMLASPLLLFLSVQAIIYYIKEGVFYTSKRQSNIIWGLILYFLLFMVIRNIQ